MVSTEKEIKMAKITVYRFTNFHVATRETVRSEEYATIETIAKIQGTPLEDTVMEIDDSCLDKRSFYVPRTLAE
jgi:hypothetical protein